MYQETRPTAKGRAAAWIGLLLGVATTIAGCGDQAEESADDVSPTQPPPGVGARLFADTFEDDRNGWALPENQDAKFLVAGGDFSWEAKKANLRPHLLATPLGEAFDKGTLKMREVVVRATFTQLRGKAAAGVFCREVHDADSDYQWYEFVVRDGYAAIRRADSAGHLDVLATTKKVDLRLGEQATIEATCIDDSNHQAQLSLTFNESLVLQASDADPLGNGAPGLQAYDSPAEAATAPFLMRWHDFTVYQPAR